MLKNYLIILTFQIVILESLILVHINTTLKEQYSIMFTNYSDIINIEQMRNMLGGISLTLINQYKVL